MQNNNTLSITLVPVPKKEIFKVQTLPLYCQQDSCATGHNTLPPRTPTPKSTYKKSKGIFQINFHLSIGGFKTTSPCHSQSKQVCNWVEVKPSHLSVITYTNHIAYHGRDLNPRDTSLSLKQQINRFGYFGNMSLIIFNCINPIVLQIRTPDKILLILQFSFQYYIGNVYES